MRNLCGENFEEFIGINEAAAYLGVCVTTMRRWDKDGTFKAFWKGNKRFYNRFTLKALKEDRARYVFPE